MRSRQHKKETVNKSDTSSFFQKERTGGVVGDGIQPFFTNISPAIQKQSDEPKDAGDQDISGVLTPAIVPLPTFDFNDKYQQFGRFDARYTPVGPTPAEGNFEIFLWVNINYENFSAKRKKKDPYKNIKFTAEQLADFNWTDEEKNKFEFDFMTSVQTAWSNKFKFHLKDPAFSEYLTKVQITVLTVDDPKLAHAKINALKIPKNAPRFRSFVSGNEATLEKRDPTEPQKNKTTSHDFIRQIGAFGFDSSSLTPDMINQITEVVTFLKTDPNPDNWSLSFAGRASSEGSKVYNEKLGNKRSEAVRLELFRQMGWKEDEVANYITLDKGKEHAAKDPKFRRVDITVTKAANAGAQKDVEQNVAAHEAGHMFGLGDEYIRETDLLENEEPKFLADKPSHYSLVEKYVGKEEANELLIDQTNSIMSVGSTVKKGHYMPFLLAINKITGQDAEQKNWKIE